MEISALLGNLGEFVGAIAVVATLIYLSIQVKLSKEATLANTRQMEENRKLNLLDTYMRRSERVEQGYKDVALHEHLSRLIFKAYQHPGELDEYETFVLREWSNAHMHRLDAQHFQYQQGLLDEDGYDNLRDVIARFAPLWEQLDINPVRDSFRREIETVLSDNSAPSL